MRKLARFILPAAIGAMCIAFAADVSTDYDHKVDFSRYHTYSWIGVKAANSLWQDRIAGAIDSQLAARGFTRVASGGDISVAAFGRTDERDTLQTFYNGFPGWGWGGWGAGGTATTTVIPETVGSLTVDMFDSSTKKLIWRGVASGTVSSKPEKNDKKLDDAAEEMFEHFPPNSKG